VSIIETDIAIIGAGMAGASLAAMLGDTARVLLIDQEAQPGYHSTGRSAAFWSEGYGGPRIQPLTTASGPWLADHGFLAPRGCVHIADAAGEADLDALEQELAGGGIETHRLDRAALDSLVPGLAPHIARGISEPSCRDIDVAALHAFFLREARRAGAQLRMDARVQRITATSGGWLLATRAGEIRARLIVNAAGAWASKVASLAGAAPIVIQPYRRTIVQLLTYPAMSSDMPLVMDARSQFYFKPEAGGRLWLSPHDETPVVAHDVAPEELDVALAIDRFEHVVGWNIVRRERAWAGLRSFAPDRLPVIGYDAVAPDFFWCAGQGGFGIQTAPAAAMIAAALLRREPLPAMVRSIEVSLYAPSRFE